jgi:hypothetical protein
MRETIVQATSVLETHVLGTNSSGNRLAETQTCKGKRSAKNMIAGNKLRNSHLTGIIYDR